MKNKLLNLPKFGLPITLYCGKIKVSKLTIVSINKIKGVKLTLADIVFSAKIDESVKTKFDTLAAGAGTTQKDFLGRLVAFYEAAQARESMPQRKEIEQLRHFLARVEEIYIALVKAGQDNNEAHAKRIAELENEIIHAKAAAQEATEKAEAITREARAAVEAAQAEAALAREIGRAHV